MQTFTGKSLLDIYKQAIPFLLNTPEEVRSPRGQKVHEIIGAHIRIERPDICGWNEGAATRPYPVQYLKDELCAYLACDRSLKTFGGISKFWNQLSDDGETVNSAYGYLVNSLKQTNPVFDRVEPQLDTIMQLSMAWRDEVMTQMQWVVESFKNDKDTRQALMFVASPRFQYRGNKDFICTLNYHFIIDSNDRLNMIVNRRSQDIHFGMTFDVPWEAVLQQIVLYEVQQMYPEVSLGSYQLNCNSLHMYERNFDVYTDFAEDSTHVDTCLPPMNGNYFDNEYIKRKVNGTLDAYKGDDAFLQWLLK
jgi:thymidylate synthase